MYMILYYDSRIRDAVVEGWAVDRVERLEYRAEVNIPEDKIHPHDSYNFKDPKIPITYKNSVAQRLYAAESDVFKAHIRTQLEAWNDNGTTVHTNDEDERLTLVREYHKYVRVLMLYHHTRSDVFFSRNNKALSRNVGVVLRNVERKCAAKGIVWLASPSPSKGGKPVAYLYVSSIPSSTRRFSLYLPFLASALELPPLGKISKHSSVKRRPKSSRLCSRRGSTRFIVRPAFVISPLNHPLYLLQLLQIGLSTASNGPPTMASTQVSTLSETVRRPTTIPMRNSQTRTQLTTIAMRNSRT